MRKLKTEKCKLKAVEIKGYKSIATECPAILRLSDVNILLGANGAGKSNIVSFFRMLGAMMKGAFSLYVEKEGTAAALLHYGAKFTSTLEGGLQLSFDNHTTVNYRFSLTYAAPARLIFSQESLEQKAEATGASHTVKLQPDYRESALPVSRDETAVAVTRFLQSCKVYQFHDTSAEAPLRQPCRAETAHYLQAQGDNLPAFLYLLRENYPAAYGRIVTYVNDVVPQFKDFCLEPLNGYISLRWNDCSPTDYVFGCHQLSDGSLRFIALATLLLQPADMLPPVIILDEPELGLHPYAITQLAEMLKDAATHSQIIIATQSKDLVDHFEARNVTIVEMDKDKKYTRVHRLDEKEYGQWLEQYTISELWDKNVIGGRPV